MKARTVVLAAFALFFAAGLTACGGSSEKSGLGSATTPGGGLTGFESELLHPHRYTLKQVRAAFATQGIALRRLRSSHGRVIVLFDPRWHAPSAYHYVGKQPSATEFVIAVHSGPTPKVTESDGNVWLAYGHGEGPSVQAALHKLDQSSMH